MATCHVEKPVCYFCVLQIILLFATDQTLISRAFQPTIHHPHRKRMALPQVPLTPLSRRCFNPPSACWSSAVMTRFQPTISSDHEPFPRPDEETQSCFNPRCLESIVPLLPRGHHKRVPFAALMLADHSEHPNLTARLSFLPGVILPAADPF